MLKAIVITGAAGFIGQRFVEYLNDHGYNNLILVDTLSQQNYFKNLIGLKYADIINFENGIDQIEKSLNGYEIEAVFHIGANADVLIDNCNIMMEMNFDHSKFWFNICQKQNATFIYASSSAVYGNGERFRVILDDEKPHNEYAFSKLVFDNYVRAHMGDCKNKVIGFRFFNVFGLGEFHKGKNASLPYRFFSFIHEKGLIDLFDRDIKRDYVSVDDICKILFDSWQSNVEGGIYNLGSGNPIAHYDLAKLVVETMLDENMIEGPVDQFIKKIPMPEMLADKFQYLTKAEELPIWIEEETKDNESKIKAYIKELCKRVKNEN